MPASDRGGLKSAFAGFKKSADEDAERKLLGRPVEAVAPEQGSAEEPPATPPAPLVADSYQSATKSPPSWPAVVAAAPPSGLIARPLRQREAVRQLSFRCPVSLAAELRRKAAYNQLEHQEIIVEGIRRVLVELEEPPVGWSGDF